MQLPKILSTTLGLLSFLFLFTSCSNEEEIPDVSLIKADFKVRRLEREMQDLHTKDDVKRYLDENPKLAEQFFHRGSLPDSVLINQVYQFVSFEFNDTLLMDVERIFGDFKDVEEDFRQAFQYMQYYYPNTHAPDIYTVASGFGSFEWGADLFIGSDFIVIGLDYFAGNTATYRPTPEMMPGYMLTRYEKEYIVPMTMTFLSQRFIKNDILDQSLLADMLFYGKSLYFVDKMMPYSHDTLTLGYSAEELANVQYNEQEIFTHFVEKNILFETSPSLKQKYVGERPKVSEIADACPGRVGRWLGWQIVQQYMHENTDITFQEMLQNTQSQQIFQQSRYQPKQREL